MAWQSNATNITVNHHRNGVGGRGFTAITFTLNEPDEKKYNGTLVGIVPDDDEYKFHNVECFIINPKKPGMRYRGDNFNSQMREIIKAHDIKVIQQFDYRAKHPSKIYVDPCITKFKDMNEVESTITPPAKPPKTTTRFESIVE